MSHKVNNFSFAKEVWHAIAHGVGFFLGIAALVLLIVFLFDSLKANIDPGVSG